MTQSFVRALGSAQGRERKMGGARDCPYAPPRLVPSRGSVGGALADRQVVVICLLTFFRRGSGGLWLAFTATPAGTSIPDLAALAGLLEPQSSQTRPQVWSSFEDSRLAAFLPRRWMSLRDGYAFQVRLWSVLCYAARPPAGLHGGLPVRHRRQLQIIPSYSCSSKEHHLIPPN